MKTFTYERVTDANAAVEAAVRTGGRFISGGTNLLDLMKLEIERPEHLIDISRLPLRAVEQLPDGSLRIGGQVANSDLAADMVVRQRYPLLAQALLSGASGQLRNKASTAGNLLQRTRCPYFYYPGPAGCNKREPGSGCSAFQGFNRNHAILGASDSCIATHPSDMAVAMTALDAEIEVLSPDRSKRRIPVDLLYRPPDDAPHRETVLQPGEMITAAILPPPPLGRHHYRKVRDRASYEFALVSVGVIVAVERGRIDAVRIAFGGVAHKPWRSGQAEETLLGQPATMSSYEHAADIALAGAIGRGHNDFKIDLAKRTLCRTLADATELE